MTCSLLSVSDRNIERILRDPPLVYRIIAPDDPEAYKEARNQDRKPSFLQKLFGGRKPEVGPEDLEMLQCKPIQCFLDKAWDGIHYLFTGTSGRGAPPMNFLLAGGKELNQPHQTLRLITSTEVKAAFEALRLTSDEELRNRFQPKDMLKKDIYPNIWARDPSEDDTLGYLMNHVAVLRQFLADLVARGLGAIGGIG